MKQKEEIEKLAKKAIIPKYFLSEPTIEEEIKEFNILIEMFKAGYAAATPEDGLRGLREVLKECDDYLSEELYEKGKPVHLNYIGAYSKLHHMIKTALTLTESATPSPSIEEKDWENPETWKQLNENYKRKPSIEAGQATPVKRDDALNDLENELFRLYTLEGLANAASKAHSTVWLILNPATPAIDKSKGYSDWMDLFESFKGNLSRAKVECLVNAMMEYYSQPNSEAGLLAIELANALRMIVGIEAWIGDRKMKEHFQKTVYPVLEKYDTLFTSKEDKT